MEALLQSCVLFPGVYRVFVCCLVLPLYCLLCYTSHKENNISSQRLKQAHHSVLVAKIQVSKFINILEENVDSFIILNKYLLENSKETERAIALCCTESWIVLILLESHQDLSATETFF